MVKFASKDLAPEGYTKKLDNMSWTSLLWTLVAILVVYELLRKVVLKTLKGITPKFLTDALWGRRSVRRATLRDVGLDGPVGYYGPTSGGTRYFWRGFPPTCLNLGGEYTLHLPAEIV